MTQAKPFRILGLQQIAIGGSSKDRLKSLWVDMLGLTVKSTFVSERENVDEDICALGSGPTAIEVDLMQPLDPDKKPAVHATPLNHVGLWVDDLPKAVEWMTAHGVRFAPGGIRKGAAVAAVAAGWVIDVSSAPAGPAPGVVVVISRRGTDAALSWRRDLSRVRSS